MVSTSNTRETSVLRRRAEARFEVEIRADDRSDHQSRLDLPVTHPLDPVGESGDLFIADLRARRRPRLIVISGPSGVGKDTVIERLRDAYPEIHFAVTATTRPRRPGEIDGIHYYFLDPATFAERLDHGEFLESAVVYNHQYGVPKGPVRQALQRGQDVVIKVDVQGAATIRELVPHGTYIFLAPESMDELLQRLQSRKSDDPDVLMARFMAADRELRRAREFDFVIFNERERIDRTIAKLSAIIDAEHHRIDQPEIVL
jgi:guanylate kinase